MKVPKFTVGDVIWIKWEDHYHNYTAGWSDADGRKEAGGYSPMFCETVGFVLNDDGKNVALAISKDIEGNYSNGGYSVKIKRTIVDYKVLKKGKK